MTGLVPPVDQPEPALDLLTGRPSMAQVQAELVRWWGPGQGVRFGEEGIRGSDEYVVERQSSGWRWGYSERGSAPAEGHSGDEAEAAAGVRTMLADAGLLPRPDPLGLLGSGGGVPLVHRRQLLLGDLRAELTARGLVPDHFVRDATDPPVPQDADAPVAVLSVRHGRHEVHLARGGGLCWRGSSPTEAEAVGAVRNLLAATGVVPEDPWAPVEPSDPDLERWRRLPAVPRPGPSRRPPPATVSSWHHLGVEVGVRCPPGVGVGPRSVGMPASRAPSWSAVAARARLVREGLLPADPLGPWLPGQRLTTRPADQLELTPELLAEQLLEREVLLLELDDLLVRGTGPAPSSAPVHGFRLRVVPVASRLRTWFVEGGVETWCGSAARYAIGGFIWRLLLARGDVTPATDPWERFRTPARPPA